MSIQNNTEQLTFKSVKEFVNYLIDNEGKILSDSYGRKWKYENYGFQFKDIGVDDVFKDGLKCVHLFKTIQYPNQQDKEVSEEETQEWLERWRKVRTDAISEMFDNLNETTGIYPTGDFFDTIDNWLVRNPIKGNDKEVKEGEAEIWDEVGGILYVNHSFKCYPAILDQLQKQFHITRKGKELNK